MSEKILVPELGESITEATVSKWLKSAGDSVEADEPIVELETDKVNLEVPSPVNGVLGKISASEGDVVEVGSTLGHINSGSNIQTSDIPKNEEVKKKENNVIKIDVEKKTEAKKTDATKKISTFKKKKKVKRNISSGIAYVYSTFNNTIVSIADENGNVVSWSSAGAKGFKGSRKSTPYAAQVAADAAGLKAYEQGLRTLTVQVKGPGSGRETALRSLQSRGFRILSIKDTTPMPHNGARPPKRRRV